MINQLIKVIAKSNCVAFLGAGASFGAVSVSEQRPPLGSELATALNQIANTDSLDLENAAQTLIDDHILRERLLDYLRSVFSIKHPGKEYEKLINQSWRRIYTTNYDDALLVASSRGKPYSYATPADAEFTPSRDQLIYLNGSITDIDTPGSLDTGLVLGRNASFQGPSLPTLGIQFEQDASLADAIIFIGYSLPDFPIEQTIRRLSLPKEKVFFINKGPLDSNTAFKFNQLGQVIEITFEDFANHLSLIGTKNEEKTENISPFSRTIFSPPEGSTSHIARQYLKYGIVNQEIAEISALSEAPFMIERDILPEVTNADHDHRITLIHAKRGNGKTSLLHQVAIKLDSSGEKVYFYTNLSPRISEDLEFLKSREGWILIDSNQMAMPDFLNILEEKEIKTKIIYFVNTAAYQLLGFGRSLIDGNCNVFDANKISKGDLVDVEDVLSREALWGEMQSESTNARLDYLENGCNAEFLPISAAIIRNPEARQQIANDFRSLFSKPGQDRDLAILSLVLSICDIPIKLATVANFSRRPGQERRSKLFSEYFTVRNGIVYAPGEAFSKECLILGNLDDKELLKFLISIVKSSFKYNHHEFKKIRIQIMRFSNIEKIFTDLNKKEHIIRLYEEYARIADIRKNREFWHQFSIACMAFQEFDLAFDRLKTAFALAKQTADDRETYMMDHHHSRLLLESRRSDLDSYDDQAAALQTAAELVVRQVTSPYRSHGEYPYRVVRMLPDYLLAVRHVLTVADVHQIQTALTDVERAIVSVDKYGDQSSAYNALRRARNALPKA